ncbi:MAG: iron-sulfur cluster assembly protein [Phycisphaeraceae bacterium]|nr:iron-sulfur cluster assembly protein [Phycisphaeraceae bacterium]
MNLPLPQHGDQQPRKKPDPTPADPDKLKTLHDKIIHAAKQVYDPEIPINIHDLGLIYKIDADEETGSVKVDMTLTSANCPEAQSLPAAVRQEILAIPEVNDCDLQLVWDPPWSKEMMSEEAQLQLGLM